MARPGIEGLQKKRERLEAELTALREREAAELERRAAIAGRAVLARAESDEPFRQTLTELLDAEVVRAAERRLLGLPSRRRRKVGAGKGTAQA
jgi:hypothetical protein